MTGIQRTPKQKGQGMVEFMLVLPVLLLVTMGIVEFARMFAIYTMVSSASREAARYGASVGDNGSGTPKYLDCAGIRDAARRVAIFSVLSDTDIQVRYDDGTTAVPIATCDSGPDPRDIDLGDRVIVTVNASYSPIVPLLPMIPTQTLTSSTARTILKEIEAGPTATLGGLISTSTSPPPTNTNTPDPAASPTSTPTPTNTATAGPSPTPVPTNTPVPSPTPVPPPQNFSASLSCSNGRVSFNWSTVPDADYYAVYRIDPPPETMIVIDSSPPCNNCDILAPGSGDVTYVVVAVLNGRESTYSNSITVSCP